MKKIIDNHALYYLFVGIVILLGLFAVLSNEHDKGLQMVIVVLMAFFYVASGVIHHLLSHDITAKIVVEYVLIASVGIAIVFFILRAGFGL